MFTFILLFFYIVIFVFKNVKKTPLSLVYRKSLIFINQTVVKQTDWLKTTQRKNLKDSNPATFLAIQWCP